MRQLTFILISCLSAAGMSLLGQAPAPSTETHEIQVSVRKYQFDPNMITVRKGEHMKLTITAIDHDHGFKLDAFQIDRLLKKGQTTTIEFTADKAGTFPFQCPISAEWDTGDERTTDSRRLTGAGSAGTFACAQG